MTTIDHQAFFIDGAWRPAKSEDRFEITSPRSEEIIGHVPAASTADIDDAVAAARRAFDEGEWPRLTPAERADYLTRMADAIAKRQDELAPLITEELGCTLFLSQVYQVVSPVMSLNYNAEIGRGLDTEQVRLSDLGPLAASSEGGSIIPMAGASLVVQEPVGVVAAFPAYNFAFPAVPPEGRTGADRRVHCGGQGDRAQPAGDVHLRRHLRGDRPAPGRHQHRRRPGSGGRVPRAPSRGRHGQLHRLGADRSPHRRRLWRAHQAVRPRARRQVRGDRPRRREAGGRAARAHRRQCRHERRPELRRPDPPRRAGRAVRRLRRGACRGLPRP